MLDERMNVTEIGKTMANDTDVDSSISNGDTTAHKLLYCGQGLDDFHTSYSEIHGILCLLVCIFGSIANTLNVIVLTRREMRSPTNFILTGLAIADLLVMLDYIPYAVYMSPYTRFSREERLTYSWSWYVMFHSIFAQICHTISIWLTVTLAVWRYIAVAYPQKNRIWCGTANTLIAIISSYVLCPLLGIPLYLSFSIKPRVEQLGSDGNPYKAINNETARNITLYRMVTSEVAESNPTLLNVNFWIYSVVIKLIPCIVLTILSLRLIAALLEAKHRRKQLTGGCSSAMKPVVDDGKNAKLQRKKSSKNMDKEKQTDRTTRMLLAVLLLFLITEFPQGILGLLSAVLEKHFFYNCYLKLGDLMDMLALINSAINFILYCSMSRQFRNTFNYLFHPKFLDSWLPVPQNGEDAAMGRRNRDGVTTQITQV